jgi:non-ribosomal peptide synthetase component F
LQKYCNSEDVLFGATVSGRTTGIKGIENMVGLFINTIPLRVQTYGEETIIEMAPRIDKALREREEFEYTPLVDIRSYSPVEISESLFDTIVAIENYPLDNRLTPAGSELSIQSYSIAESTNYDLIVGILPFDGIEVKFSYKRDIFSAEMIEGLARHFNRIVLESVAKGEQKVNRLEILSIEEKRQILFDFNGAEREYPNDKTIHRLFEEQVERTPDHIAVVKEKTAHELHEFYELKEISYRKLNDLSDQIAFLLNEKGVLPGDIVGIMVERSVEMIVGILGILKRGAAYLPINPEQPEFRTEYILKDSGAKILLTAVELSDIVRAKHLESLKNANASPLRKVTAYIIYTSGYLLYCTGDMNIWV